MSNLDEQAAAERRGALRALLPADRTTDYGRMLDSSTVRRARAARVGPLSPKDAAAAPS